MPIQQNQEAPRDHGGDLAAARRRYGSEIDWIDLSTGVNPRPYPIGELSAEAWARLPDKDAENDLIEAARLAYCAHSANAIVAAAGGSALIALAPRLAANQDVAIQTPTYNEHAAAFTAEGWRVVELNALEDARDEAALVVVSPNNPTGARFDRGRVLRAAQGRALVVVDESFMDMTPEQSLCAEALPENMLVLRSFGKFYGLAGLRLGFAVAAPSVAARLAAMIGPWAVSGPALEIGRRALLDAAWSEQTRERVSADCERLCGLADRAGWRSVGGAALFHLFETPDSAAAKDALARHGFWSRIFPYSERWIRLGLPDGALQWRRLEQAFDDIAARG